MDATRAVVREFNLSDALRAASGATLGALLLVVSSPAARAQGTPADYERANALQAKYEGAAIDIAGPATWIGKSDKLWYRKLSRGSTQYFIYDAQSQHKQIAFDNEKIAASLSKITGNTYDPRKLPFNFIAFEENAEAFAVTVDGTRVRCTTADSACKRIETSGGFGGRGAQSGREGQTRVSPDGNWEAIINNFNVAVRPAHGRELKFLSTDGSEGNYYELSSIVWSPDSTKLAAYRVKPGYHREIHYVESSPEDQLQPELLSLAYAKPGDVLDLDQPVFLIRTRRNRSTSIIRFSRIPSRFPIWSGEKIATPSPSNTTSAATRSTASSKWMRPPAGRAPLSPKSQKHSSIIAAPPAGWPIPARNTATTSTTARK